MQREDQGVGVAQQLHQTADVLQVAAAQPLRLHDQDGLGPGRFDAPEHFLDLRPAVQRLTGHDLPVSVFLRDAAQARQVAFYPFIKHLLVLGQHFLHGQDRVICPRLSQVEDDSIRLHRWQIPHFTTPPMR